jgi:hypothetical protein
MILIGSRALQKFDINLERGEGHVQDWDYIATREELEDFKTYRASTLVHATKKGNKEVLYLSGYTPMEFEVAENGNSAELLLDLLNRHNLIDYGDVVFPDVVYTLKMSHRYLKDSPHFRKTMADIHHLRNEGCSIPSELKEWFKIRTKETYWYKHPSLAQNKKEFFSDDGVGYIYDHDSIHEAVKHLSAPAFELIKEDKAEVFTSKEKFFSLPRKIQLLTVLEESYVLALERSQIPNDFKPTPEASFNKALEKVCTSIASGWWREFAWENYHDVLSMYNENYVEMFKLALAEGRIRDYETNRPVLQTA